MTRYWTKLFVLITFISTLTVFLWTAIYSTFPYGLLNIVVELFSTASFYLILILVLILCLLPHFLFLYLQNTYFPKDVDIIRERRLVWDNTAAVYKKDDDLPSAITLPPSPTLGHSPRAPSYTTALDAPYTSSTEPSPTLRAPLQGSFTTTPPQVLTPPMEEWHSPPSVWHSPSNSDMEMSEYVHESERSHSQNGPGLQRRKHALKYSEKSADL